MTSGTSTWIALASAAIVLGTFALGFTGPASAHGGGLNRCGCHHDRRTGDCHCHHDYGCGCECEPPHCARD